MNGWGSDAPGRTNPYPGMGLTLGSGLKPVKAMPEYGFDPGALTWTPQRSSAPPISGMVAPFALVAAAVVAGDAGREFLGVAGLDLGEELIGLGAAQGRGVVSVVGDADVGPSEGVLESFGWHGAILQVFAKER